MMPELTGSEFNFLFAAKYQSSDESEAEGAEGSGTTQKKDRRFKGTEAPMIRKQPAYRHSKVSPCNNQKNAGTHLITDK